MTFTSGIFLIGLMPWFIILYQLLGVKKNIIKCRIILILLANSIFYAGGGMGSFIFLCLYSIIIYFLEYLELKLHKKWLFVFSLIIAAFPLICIKYITFAIDNINSIFGSNIISPSIIVPVGISFFSFEAISLLADTHKGKIRGANLIYIYIYLSFFPTITSGPIIRFDEFEQGVNNPTACKINYFDAVERIIIGLSKKVLIADKIAALANYYFDGVAVGNNYSTIGFWMGSIAYTLQLYFDFSGYSDMAIGIGALLGFNIRENFDKPYQSSTISEFWKKWHISLTRWFRDYIYIPLGGNRCKISRHLLNMLIVWLLTGIWHGADWTFIIWGLGYFVLLIIEKYTPLAKRISFTVLGRIYTLFFVNILWVFFRADNLNVANQFLKGMFGGGTGLIEDKALHFLPFTGAVVVLCFPWNKWLVRFSDKRYFRIIKPGMLILLTGLAVCASVNSSYAPYIYGKF